MSFSFWKVWTHPPYAEVSGCIGERTHESLSLNLFEIESERVNVSVVVKPGGDWEFLARQVGIFCINVNYKCTGKK